MSFNRLKGRVFNYIRLFIQDLKRFLIIILITNNKGYKMKKDNVRLKDFLKDDFLKIQINLSEIKDQLNKYNYNSKEKEFENIEDILSYWFQHHKNL